MLIVFSCKVAPGERPLSHTERIIECVGVCTDDMLLSSSTERQYFTCIPAGGLFAAWRGV